MELRKWTGILCLLGVALIFGFAFSFQAIAAAHVPPFFLNGIRFLIASLVLGLSFFRKGKGDTKTLIKAGLLDGLLIVSATSLQQIAIADTSAGKTGFLTALYIVFVPLMSFLFLGKRFGKNVVISVILALFGLYLLCGLSLSDLHMRSHDLFLVGTALLFSLQILAVEHYVTKIDPLQMTAIAFFSGGLISLFIGIFFETLSMEGLRITVFPILYLSLISTCLGYGLQAVGQQLVEGTAASLLMSLEAVFSAVGGYLLLGQILSPRELLGASLLFAAVILCQIPERRKS